MYQVHANPSGRPVPGPGTSQKKIDLKNSNF